MNKIIVSSLVAIVALGANVAAAQSYYPQPYGAMSYQTQTPYQQTQTPYQQPYSGACVNLVSDLSYGSRGSQVSQLQTFLVTRNYPGGGSWMITGYFGRATQAAVRNFQMEQGLSPVGVVGPATRAAISRVSCGGMGGYNYNNSYPSPFAQGYGGTQYTTPPSYNYNNNYNNNTNCYYTYPYTCNTYNYGSTVYGNVTLTSFSVTSAAPGTSVTIYGSNFDYSNNTVYFGTTPLSNISSYNGTSLTVTVPSYALAGNLNVYVVNPRGTSNTLAFNVIAGYGGCNPNSQGGYPYNYGYNNTYCPPNTGYPYLTYLSPNSGAIGSMVTITGSGFSSTGNTVRFGGGVITGVSSSNGQTLSFIVPSQLSGTSQYVTNGSYNVSVSNSSGQTSNALSFNVTSSGSYGAPTITSLNGPTSLTTLTSGTWTIIVNNPSNSYMTTSVNWGDAGYGYNATAPQTTYAQGSNTLTFTHAYSAAGTYTVTFTVSNGSGQQNTSSATVWVGGSGTSGQVTLSYLTPVSGQIGTQIMLQGSGFNALDNTVRFGIGGTLHVPSFNNGTTIYYTVPSFVNPCDVATQGQGNICSPNTQQVQLGPIQVYVTNTSGTSQTLMFQVI